MALNSQIIAQWRYTIETIRPCFCSVLHTPSKVYIVYSLEPLYLCIIFEMYWTNLGFSYRNKCSRTNVLDPVWIQRSP